jgi:hypothetical protein
VRQRKKFHEEATMGDDMKTPKPGDLVIDASPLREKLVDLPEGGLKGLAHEKEGFKELMEELTANQEIYGVRAGISSEDLKNIGSLNLLLAEIDSYIPAANKLAELLQESRAYYEDKRERFVKLLVDSLLNRSRANQDKEILARYEKTRAYYSQIGKKAAQTRAKKAKTTEK